MVRQVVPLYQELQQGVELIEGVQGPQEVARVALGGEEEEVAEGWWDERRELLLGEEF